MERSVVVTGATSGIGKASALALARRGYRVIGTARDAEKARLLRQAAQESDVTVETVVLDVTDELSCKEAFSQIADLTDGGPWCVINNAATARAGAIEDINDQDVRELLETNLIAPARISKLVIPAMRKRGTGRIINISSIGGRVSLPFNGWYTASKHGLESLSDALRMEVARDNIHVVLIEPGGSSTKLWETGAASIPQAGRPSPFSDCYPHFQGILAAAKNLPAPERVARAVVRSVIAGKPRSRYLVGTNARLLAPIDTLLPTALTDRGKQLVVGLRASRITTRLWRTSRG